MLLVVRTTVWSNNLYKIRGYPDMCMCVDGLMAFALDVFCIYVMRKWDIKWQMGYRSLELAQKNHGQIYVGWQVAGAKF